MSRRSLFTKSPAGRLLTNADLNKTVIKTIWVPIFNAANISQGNHDNYYTLVNQSGTTHPYTTTSNTSSELNGMYNIGNRVRLSYYGNTRIELMIRSEWEYPSGGGQYYRSQPLYITSSNINDWAMYPDTRGGRIYPKEILRGTVNLSDPIYIEVDTRQCSPLSSYSYIKFIDMPSVFNIYIDPI